ncbi:MAG: diguanylate cyclase domain-containing protein [Pseudothermotoga sp.]
MAIFPRDGKTVEELIKNADKAMYEAKNAQNNYVFSSQAEEI